MATMSKMACASLGVTLTIMALVAMPQTVSAQSIGIGSCSTGTDPCDGNIGSIGDRSCNDDRACSSNSGTIGDDSCNGFESCERNSGTIGDDSCNDTDSCAAFAGDTIGNNSCNDSFACMVFAGDTIGANSCNGSFACEGVQGNVGANSCNGRDACEEFPGDTIGNNSCNGFFACEGVQGSVGANSCNGRDACVNVQGSVGANSCNGEEACKDAMADIGDCQHNTVSVPACADTDADDVTDDKDTCPNTPAEALVNADGCAIGQLCPCARPWENHGQYVSCVTHTAEDFVAAGLIPDEDKDAIVSEAAQSSCGKKK